MTEVCSGDKSNKNICLGHISGVYGVKGWVKVYSFTSPIENILKYKVWRLQKDGKITEYKLESGRKHGKIMVAKLESIDDRDQAAKLYKSEIIITRNQLPALADDEYYWSDLEGLKVFNVEGQYYGVVDHLFETGANDVMVVRGDKEILIPFVQDDYIKNIDLEQGSILVDWPEEL